VHYWLNLLSVHGFRCYDNTAPNAKCQQVLVLALSLVSVAAMRTGLKKVDNRQLVIVPPHLTNASAPPDDTDKHSKSVSNVALMSYQHAQKHIEIVPRLRTNHPSIRGTIGRMHQTG